MTTTLATNRPGLAPNETHESHVLYKQAMEKLSRNRVEDALKDLQEALRICPDNPDYLSHCGLCVAMHREDFYMAIKLCRRAVNLNGRNAVYQVNLGKVYRLLGDNSMAHEIFLQAWGDHKRHPGPATELTRMGIRRKPFIHFLPRSHWLNRQLGMLRAKLERSRARY